MLPFGSTTEGLAHLAVVRKNRIQYLQTVTVVNAIIHLGNTIVAAINKSGQGSSADGLRKSLEELKKQLLPTEVERLEKRAEEVKQILSDEVARGPIKVKAVGHGKLDNRQNRARRRRQ